MQPETLQQSRDEWERGFLLERALLCKWNVSDLALELQVSRTNLYRRFKMFGIDAKAERRRWERSLENR